MKFMKRDGGHDELDRALKAQRAEPSRNFVRSLAARVDEGQRSTHWIRPRSRGALVGLLAAAALIVSASAGALSTAHSTAAGALHVVRALTGSTHAATPAKSNDTGKKDDDDNPGRDQYKHNCGHSPHERCHARMTPDHIITFEGNSGQKTVTFTVTLTNKSDGSVDIPYTTLDGTAHAADQDYVSKSGTLHFALGETTKTITVTINGDTKVEHNEDFFVKIVSGGPTVKIDGDGKNRVEISNDDHDLSRQV